jgi:hypothetical protein
MDATLRRSERRAAENHLPFRDVTHVECTPHHAAPSEVDVTIIVQRHVITNAQSAACRGSAGQPALVKGRSWSACHARVVGGVGHGGTEPCIHTSLAAPASRLPAQGRAAGWRAIPCGATAGVSSSTAPQVSKYGSQCPRGRWPTALLPTALLPTALLPTALLPTALLPTALLERASRSLSKLVNKLPAVLMWITAFAL